MASSKYSSIEDYIRKAPALGQEHLKRLYLLLQKVAPEAERVMKWNTPFFIEPRFLFAFAAHKEHLSFTPNAEGLEPFAQALERFETSQESLKVRYKDSLPEELIRKMAEYKVKLLQGWDDAAFW